MPSLVRSALTTYSDESVVAVIIVLAVVVLAIALSYLGVTRRHRSRQSPN